MTELERFINNLHPSTKFLCQGTVTLLDHIVDAVLVRNLYGQNVVWGPFSVDGRKGKFVGKIANDANTEGVVFRYPDTLTVEWSRPISPAEIRLNKQWLDNIEYPNMSNKIQ